MALAPSPARNASTAATSAGLSSRPMGCCAAKARAPGRSYRRALSSRMRVAVDPGLTAFAVTPVPPSSTARARTKPVTPALAAPYAASKGIPRVAAAEATARKRPCRGSGRRSMAGTVTRARVSTPPRLMSSTARCCSSGSCQAGTPPAMTPAAATAASSPPQRSSASLTALARASGSRVSACAAMTAASPAPASPATLQASATTRSSSPRDPSAYGRAVSSPHRSTATTRHPPAARAATVAAPIPRAAPVTSATRVVTAGPCPGRRPAPPAAR